MISKLDFPKMVPFNETNYGLNTYDFFCTWPCFGQVLATIEKMNQTSTPRPFSQNCQYKKNQPDDGEISDGDGGYHQEPKSTKKPKGGVANKSKKKKKAPAQLSKAKLVEEKKDDPAAVLDWRMLMRPRPTLLSGKSSLMR